MRHALQLQVEAELGQDDTGGLLQAVLEQLQLVPLFYPQSLQVSLEDMHTVLQDSGTPADRLVIRVNGAWTEEGTSDVGSW